MEGDSAGGSAKQGRDRRSQAILPLKGKILNVEKARFDKMISSEEIRTMIAALGTGIGDKDYNINSLRYHKVIIMTDADVDGAHIRTLLLTFFFRQMPDLIDKGYLYVAQPPLYRILAGKQELFIKNEDEFSGFLLKKVCEKEKVVMEDGEEVSGVRLVRLLNGVIKFYESLNKLSRRGYSPRFIEFLASEGPTDKGFFKNEKSMSGLFEKLHKKGFRVQDAHLDEESGYYEFLLTETHNGGQTSAVNWEFLSSPELRQVMGISKEFRELKKAKYISAGDGEKRMIKDPQELLTELFDKAKKGMTIQRYKGLGEMNPGQLWTTTMDPDRRTLLKVRVEDAVEADDMFTVLMGDKVEPRREFIQNNALEVTELDI